MNIYKPYYTESTPVMVVDQHGLPIQQIESTDIPLHINLTESNDGLGNVNFNNDYSIVNKDVGYIATAEFHLYSFNIALSDNGDFGQLEYGKNVALTNGLEFYIKPVDNVEYRIFSNINLKTNLDCAGFFCDYNLVQWVGSMQTAKMVVDSIKNYGCPIILNQGDKIFVRLKDNFVGIVNQTFSISGKKVV